jgi:hypothetical protein
MKALLLLLLRGGGGDLGLSAEEEEEVGVAEKTNGAILRADGRGLSDRRMPEAV